MGYVEAIYRGPNIRATNQVKPQPKLRFLSEMELRPFDLSIVTNLLGLYIPLPKSASTYDSKRDRLEPVQKNAGFLPRSRQDIQDGPLKNLLALLETIVDAQFKKVNLHDIKNSLKAETIREIFFHQGSLNREEYAHFASLIGYWYSKLYEEALIERKYIQNPFYHHPNGRRGKTQKQENINQQLATFTEINVNSWAITDDEDPTIVYSSEGGASLLSNRHDVPFDERKVLDVPSNNPRAYQPGYDELLKAFDCMARDTALEEKRYKEWVTFGEGQIRALQDKLLGGNELEIPRSRSRAWLGAFRVGDDPKEAASKILMNSNVRKVTDENFAQIVNGLNKRLQEEYNKTGSNYWKLQTWKTDLKLRGLKREISKKLRKRWRFILQRTPTNELAIQGSRCAHPTCKYHQNDAIPAGSFRLNFMDPDQHREEQAYFLNEALKDDPGTPGRAANGQMWFCLTCVENLFDGEGLINKIGVETDDRKTSSETVILGTSEVQSSAAWQDRLDETAAVALANAVDPAVAKSFAPLLKKTGRNRKNVGGRSQNSTNKNKKSRSEGLLDQERAAQKESAAPEPSCSIPYRVAPNVGHSRLTAGDSIQIADEDDTMIMKALHVTESSISNKGRLAMKKTAGRTRTLDAESFPQEYSISAANLDSPTPMITPTIESDPVFTYPVPPRLFRAKPPLGLTPFTSALSSFIDPEIRYTISECYTLSPQEYFGLHRWKDLSTRLGPWLHLVNENGAAATFDLDDDDFLERNGILRDIHDPNTIGSREVDGQKLTMADCILLPGMELPDGVILSEDLVKLKPLSEIMILIDSRNRRPAEADMQRDFLTIAEREWPFHSFWEREFEIERMRLEGVKLSERILENEKILFELNKGFMETEKKEKERRREQKEVIRRLEEAAALVEAQKLTEQAAGMSIGEKIKMNDKIIEGLKKETGEGGWEEWEDEE